MPLASTSGADAPHEASESVAPSAPAHTGSEVSPQGACPPTTVVGASFAPLHVSRTCRLCWIRLNSYLLLRFSVRITLR
jgi:hypothetical protein